MSLTAHQRIELLRRFPDGQLSVDPGRVAIVFPDGSRAFAYLLAGMWASSMGGSYVGISSLDRALDARDALREMLS